VAATRSRVDNTSRYLCAVQARGNICKYRGSLRLRKPVNAQVESDKTLAYGTFRLSLGINELMHGLVRLPILTAFAENTAKSFEGTVLPGWFVYAFGLMLPCMEALLGIALILGLLTRWALLTASLLMSVLIFGTALRADWATVGVQMVYVIAYFLAFLFLEYNRYSLDRIFDTRA
jgi:thiosulfate dehydrogenase [quinone] large subunit